MRERAVDVFADVQTRAKNGNKPSAAADARDTKAVVLAGGRGTRLAPYTSVLPKPLMPVGDRAILEILVEQLAECGITRLSFCVGYLSHLIRAVFENGALNGNAERVEIDYVQEREPLGTAAPLRLVPGLDRTFMVLNGDVLTTLDFGDLLDYHRQSGNVLTIATHRREIKVDYGILHLDATQRVRGFEEKPAIISAVSMGIYVMEPKILDYIPDAQHFDFPDLVDKVLVAEEPVGAYTYDGLWFDIGRHEDYEQALTAWGENTDLVEARHSAPGVRAIIADCAGRLVPYRRAEKRRPRLGATSRQGCLHGGLVILGKRWDRRQART
jgi:NDP-mannose synthase